MKKIILLISLAMLTGCGGSGGTSSSSSLQAVSTSTQLSTTSTSSSTTQTSSTTTSTIQNEVIPKITNFQVAGAFNTVIMEWDAVASNVTGNIEIWRSKTNDVATATKIETVSITTIVRSDTPPRTTFLSESFYYWVRIVSLSGTPGEFNSNQGTVGTIAAIP